MEPKHILTLDETAKRLGLSRNRVRSYVDERRLTPEYVNNNGTPYWSPEFVERLKQVLDIQRAQKVVGRKPKMIIDPDYEPPRQRAGTDREAGDSSS